MKKTAQINFLITFFTQIGQKKGLQVFFFVFMSISSFGQLNQVNEDIQNTLQTLIEDFTEFNDGGEEFDFNTLYEELTELHQNKLDLNKATSTELYRLFFLSDTDIQNIILYRENNGDFISIYELQAVSGLSLDKLSVLKLFVEVGATRTLENELSLTELDQSKDELYLKWKYNIETARGFQSINGADPKYSGNKHHLYLRYNHSANNERYGLIIEKDPGENLVNEFSETGLDYVSGHYQVQNPSTWIRQLNLGDYSVSMGQGLIAHSAFGLGKSSLTTKVKKGRSGIRSYNSVSENLAFRGIALHIGPQSSALSGIVFGSYTPRDANLTGTDSSGISTFSSLPEGGYHRTIGEREDQDATYEFTFGGNLQYNLRNVLKIGLNTIHHNFDKRFQINTQPYQIYRWQGDQLSNYSLDYSALLGGWNIYGELAHSSNGGWANMHGLIKTLDPKFDVSIVYRDYGVSYQSLFANAFGESSSVNNEKGIYFGIEYRPARQWSIRAFADQWQNDWLRFRVDGPSTGREYLLRVDFKEKRRRHYYFQYRYEIKDENSSEDLLVDVRVPKIIQRLRIHSAHQLSNGLELRSRLEFSLFHKESITERGILIYQDIISRRINSPVSMSARIGYFNISDFDARIYTYENDLLFEYYIPSFSGEGLRYYAHCRYNISRSLMAEIRWEQTKFFGTDVVSSNDNLIEGSTISRIKMQLKYRF